MSERDEKIKEAYMFAANIRHSNPERSALVNWLCVELERGEGSIGDLDAALAREREKTAALEEALAAVRYELTDCLAVLVPSVARQRFSERPSFLRAAELCAAVSAERVSL